MAVEVGTVVGPYTVTGTVGAGGMGVVYRARDASPFRKNEAHLSWDGKWLAYNSNDSGSNQVWVVSFPSADQKGQISNNGGSQAHWRRDGKELYYLAPDGKMMVVDMTLGAKLDSGVPRVLFDTELVVNQVQDQYRVTPDGQRFLLLKPVNTGPTVMPVKGHVELDRGAVEVAGPRRRS